MINGEGDMPHPVVSVLYPYHTVTSYGPWKMVSQVLLHLSMVATPPSFIARIWPALYLLKWPATCLSRSRSLIRRLSPQTPINIAVKVTTTSSSSSLALASHLRGRRWFRRAERIESKSDIRNLYANWQIVDCRGRRGESKRRGRLEWPWFRLIAWYSTRLS